MLRIQQVSAGSAAFLSPTKAGLQCGGKRALLQAAIFWVAGGREGEAVLNSTTDGKKDKCFPKEVPSLCQKQTCFMKRTLEPDGVVSSRYRN